MDNKLNIHEILSLIPERKTDSSKHDYGKLLAVTGSTYYRGAAYLSCAGALRSGVGICTLASIEKVVSAVAASLPECTFLPLSETPNGTVSHTASGHITELSKRYSALLIGCGLSIDDSTRELVKDILSENLDILKHAKKPPVITPHFNEMARLCQTDRNSIAERPMDYALSFARANNCTVVLKSHVTYICTPDGQIAINDGAGNSGLAKGGSGDVLAGMIASFCAQGLSPFNASKCGVYLHGKAADLCAERLSKQAMLPSDILVDLATVFPE